MNKTVNYFDLPLSAGRGSIVMSMSVCLSVHSHNSKTTRPNFTESFSHVAQRPWLSPPLTVLRYVMYFRFCGCRYVLTNFCSTLKTGSRPTHCFELRAGSEVCCQRFLYSVIGSAFHTLQSFTVGLVSSGVRNAFEKQPHSAHAH